MSIISIVLGTSITLASNRNQTGMVGGAGYVMIIGGVIAMGINVYGRRAGIVLPVISPSECVYRAHFAAASVDQIALFDSDEPKPVTLLGVGFSKTTPLDCRNCRQP